MTDVQVLLMFLFLDSKMTKQQLQKWELKFVTELEPLEGASPVCLFGETLPEECLVACSETLKG